MRFEWPGQGDAHCSNLSLFLIAYVNLRYTGTIWTWVSCRGCRRGTLDISSYAVRGTVGRLLLLVMEEIALPNCPLSSALPDVCSPYSCFQAFLLGRSSSVEGLVHSSKVGSSPHYCSQPPLIRMQDKLCNSKMSQSVWLVGGFAASPWLFGQLQERLVPLGITVSRPDNQTLGLSPCASLLHVPTFMTQVQSSLLSSSALRLRPLPCVLPLPQEE